MRLSPGTASDKPPSILAGALKASAATNNFRHLVADSLSERDGLACDLLPRYGHEVDIPLQTAVYCQRVAVGAGHITQWAD